MTDKNGVEYDECIVGNIIGDHYWGENKEIKSGTKHFSAGTKVYCAFMYGGMGHECVRVMGKSRKSFRMIGIVLRTCYIKNFRMQKVYIHGVMEFLAKYDRVWEGEKGMRDFCELLNKTSIEIKEEKEKPL